MNSDGAVPSGKASNAEIVRHDDVLNRFYEEFYNCKVLVDYSYHKTIEKMGSCCITKAIELADLEMVKGILTWRIRAERGCMGPGRDIGEVRNFLPILRRLETLLLQS